MNKKWSFTLSFLIFFLLCFQSDLSSQANAGNVNNGFIKIAAGERHSVAVKSDGTVWTWGWNYFGQLGDGTVIDRSTPAKVNRLEGIKDIAASNNYTLALGKDGTLYGWGIVPHLDNIGAFIDKKMPFKLPGMSNIKAAAAGDGFVVVLKDDGTVWSWGCNTDGQLGDGTTQERTVPVKVEELSDIAEITSSVALKKDGSVWTWGRNYHGQLGNGTKTNSERPVQVHGLEGVKSIASGGIHNLALKSDGTVWAWGQNWKGQLGDGTYTARLTPVKVNGLANVRKISAGYEHSIALKNDGTVWTWGYNYSGELGAGGLLESKEPVKVAALSNVNEIASSSLGWHSLAIKNNGTIFSWGLNDHGQIGDGTSLYRREPLKIDDLSSVRTVAAGDYTSFAVKDDGSLWIWGKQISNSPMDSGIRNVKEVSGQLFRIYVLKNDGVVYYLEGNTKAVPLKEYGFGNIIGLSSGSNHTIALKADGTVWTWGMNQYGQLGNGSTADSDIPISVKGLAGIKSIAAGDSFSLALKDDGSVWAWGWNSTGQLGDGTSEDKLVPTKIPDLDNIAAIATGAGHAVALKNDGTLYAWGSNANNIFTNYCSHSLGAMEVPIGKISNVKNIYAGGDFTSILNKDGTVWTWGTNSLDKSHNEFVIGDNDKLVKLADDTKAIDFGSNHAVILKNDGTVWTFGSNEDGQLGNGDSDKFTPVKVKSEKVILQIDNPIMNVNGERRKIDTDGKVSPVIVGNTTLLPVRCLIESLGGSVEWDKNQQKITIRLDTNTVELRIASTKTYVNGIEKKIDVPPQILNGRTMMPLRYVMETMNCNVLWNEDNQEITITY